MADKLAIEWYIPLFTRKSVLTAYRPHAVAGCIAGLATVVALHPLDVVKTRMQGRDSCDRMPCEEMEVLF